jgi:AcrR family transcriptional regulator
MGRARPLEAEDRRAMLLAAARRVFAAKGYHNCGVSDVVEAAGVARGTFYNHFESKRAVFQAVLEDLMTEVLADVEPIDVTRPIPEQVDANLRRMLHSVTRPDLGRLLFAEAPGLDAEGDAALMHFYDRAIDRIATALKRGQELGVVRRCNEAVCARLIVGMIKEPAFQSILRGEPLDPDAVNSEIAAMLWGGITTMPGARSR